MPELEPPGLALGWRGWSLPEGMSLRPIESEDLPFLQELYASTRAEELRPVPWPEEIKQAFLAGQFALQHQHYHRYYPGAHFLLLRAHGQPVGRIYVHRIESETRLMDIALLPSWRGHGTGSALLAALLAEADAAGDSVSLHVERDNPAQRLYARLGFRLVEDGEVYQFLRRPAAASCRNQAANPRSALPGALS